MIHTHLSREERYQIHALRRRKVCIAAIAADLDCHRSTIAWKLERNASAKGHYHPVQAQVRAKERLSGRSNVRTIASDDWARVVRHLALGLSPQQVSGRLWLEKKLSLSAPSASTCGSTRTRLQGALWYDTCAAKSHVESATPAARSPGAA